MFLLAWLPAHVVLTCACFTRVLPEEDGPVATCAVFFDDAMDTELQEEFVQRPDE